MTDTPKLPLVVRVLLRLAPRDRRDFFEGDLLELLAHRHANGSGSARLRLWQDVLSLCGVMAADRWGRAARGLRLLVAPQGMAQDFRYALRLVRRQPAVSTAIVLTLALGIAANASIFSVVHGVLFKALPYEGGDRFVAIRQEVGKPPVEPFLIGFNSRDFLRLAERQTALEHLGAVAFNPDTLTGGGEPERIRTGYVSSDFFPMLGVRPVVGREFSADEYAVGHNAVALVSHELWRRRFAADPSITSRTMKLSGRTVQIAGVLPSGFQFVDPADVWVPLVFTPARLSASGWADLDVYGRLRSGSAIDAAAGILQVAASTGDPDSDSERHIRVDRVRTMLSKDVRSSLLLFWGAVALVLLIACANVASLLLARAADRRREIGIRRALGVGTGRLVRQLLIESLVLSVCGGVLGLALTRWGVSILVSISPTTIPRLNEIGVDSTVVAFTVAISVLTGLVFGVAPALQAVRLDVTAAMREGDAAASRGGFRLRSAPTRSVILVVEIAMTLVLLVGSGLLVRSFVRLQQIDTGFTASDVAAITVSIPIRRPRERVDAVAFFERATNRLAAIPGVRTAGAASGVPLTFKGGRTSFVIEGKPVVLGPPRDDPASGAPRVPPPPPPPQGVGRSKPVVPHVTPYADAIFTEVTAGYFETMGIRIREGRAFTKDDRAGSLPVVIVSESMARRYWPGEQPIGRRLQVMDGRWKTIVGIVDNVRRFRLEGEALPEMYLPISQIVQDLGDIPEHNVEAAEMTLVARGSHPRALLNGMRSAIYALNPDQPVSDAFTMEELVATIQSPRRFNMIVLTAFGVSGALLTSMGLYGVMTYLVAQRRREIGIRLALGARGRHIARVIAGEGLTLVAIGLGIGVAASFAATRLIQNLLFRVGPTDPLTLVSGVLLLFGVAAAATWLPTRRAQLVDPVTVLREE